MLKRSRLMWVVGAFVALAAGVAACGSSGSGNTSSGTTGCTPGATQACACLGGTMGVQSCKDDGRSFDTCQCGSSSGSAGTGGATTSSSSTGMQGTCGDGMIDPSDHCDNPSSEFYCKPDCTMGTGTGGSDAGTGGACAGHVYYAGAYPAAGGTPAPSVWANLPAAGGQTGLDAGNAQCKALGIGADHVCDYEEVKLAQAAAEPSFMTIPAGTSAWVQRTTTAMVMGNPSAPGPGGRCNDWTYMTNHISDGEYITFDTVGNPTYHLDNDTIFDPMNPHVIVGDLQCGGQTRSILCCYQSCN